MASRLLTDELARIDRGDDPDYRWVDVASSNLKRVCYVRGATGRLWVQFHRKPGSKFTVYVYDYVPASVFGGLLSAESKGTYFHRHIRNVYAVEPVQ